MQYRVILQNVVRHPWMYSVGVLLTIVALVLVWPRPSVSSVSRQIRAIELLPSDSVVVKNERFDGEVSFTGTLVRQNNLDAQSRLAQAEAAVQSSRAELETAREQMKKFRVLSQQNFFSRNDLEKAETQVAVYTAQVRANEAAVLMTKKALNDAVLRAPFSGVVAERMVEPGQLVMPNTPLLRLVDLSKLELAIQ